MFHELFQLCHHIVKIQVINNLIMIKKMVDDVAIAQMRSDVLFINNDHSRSRKKIV